MSIKIGIIREGKNPPDKRVPFSPQHCLTILQNFPQVSIIVQASPHRCMNDAEYAKAGLTITEDVSQCDILLGIKEVPIAELVEGKTYLFFSHTIKKQLHNRDLLREILYKNITLIDYETLVWENGSRVLGFGRYAGIVGGHNALLTYGRKSKQYDLKPAYQCKDMQDVLLQYQSLTLPPVKICLTGDGRVSHGAMEVFEKIGIREVTPRAFLNEEFNEAVYVHLRSEHYYEHHDHRPWDKSDFYHAPEDYISVFKPYTKVTDIMVNGIFWHTGVPLFFTREDMKESTFKIKVIADISCDIPGSLPSTLRSSTIENPVYGYHPLTGLETEPYLPYTVDIMAVGNLPCELPLDASLGFGDDLIRYVIPELLTQPQGEMISRATIASGGKLMPKFEYLKDYIG